LDCRGGSRVSRLVIQQYNTLIYPNETERDISFYMDTKQYDLIVFGGGNAISTAIDCGAKGMNVAKKDHWVALVPIAGASLQNCSSAMLTAEHAREAQRWSSTFEWVANEKDLNGSWPTSRASSKATVTGLTIMSADPESSTQRVGRIIPSTVLSGARSMKSVSA
jgi:hypothetical protein